LNVTVRGSIDLSATTIPAAADRAHIPSGVTILITIGSSRTGYFFSPHPGKA